MYNAQLSELPGNFGQLSSLQVLFLQQNRLQALPASMLDMKQLRNVTLGYNKFRHLDQYLTGDIRLPFRKRHAPRKGALVLPEQLASERAARHAKRRNKARKVAKARAAKAEDAARGKGGAHHGGAFGRTGSSPCSACVPLVRRRACRAYLHCTWLAAWRRTAGVAVRSV